MKLKEVRSWAKGHVEYNMEVTVSQLPNAGAITHLAPQHLCAPGTWELIQTEHVSHLSGTQQRQSSCVTMIPVCTASPTAVGGG